MTGQRQRDADRRVDSGPGAAVDDDATTLPIPVLRACAPSVDIEQASRLVAIATAAPAAIHELASSLQVLSGVEVMAELVADGPTAVRDASARAVVAWRRAEATFAVLRRLLRGGELVRWPVDLDGVVAQAIEPVALRWPGAIIRHHRRPGTQALVSEPLVIHVVSELLRNAVRATPAGGAVDVVVEADDDVTIRVIDDGPGAPAHATRHLDDPAAALDAGHRGAGLIAAALVLRLHGGVLTYRKAAGRGASFAAVLPRG